MKKCYIAGSVSGTTDFKERFAAAEIEVKQLGMQPINPVILPHQHDKEWVSYMKECINALMGCDAIYLLTDWRKSEGAKVEAKIAESLDYLHYYQGNFNVGDYPKATPITTIKMEHIAIFSNDRWVIKDKKGATIASSCDSDNITKFITPFFWQETEVYQVELLMQEGCSNTKCNYECNGCTAKTTMLDTTNYFVTILKYK